MVEEPDAVTDEEHVNTDTPVLEKVEEPVIAAEVEPQEPPAPVETLPEEKRRKPFSTPLQKTFTHA